MIVLWIILGVLAALIAIIVILLHISVRAYIEADNSRLNIEVKYLGFSLYKLAIPEKKEDAEKPKEVHSGEAPREQDKPEIEITEIPEAAPASSDEASDKYAKKEPSEVQNEDEDVAEEAPKSDKDPSEPTLLEKFNAVKKYIPAGKKAFRKLLKLIRFYGLTLELTVGSDDPYKAGMNFGRINAIAYSALGLLCCLFSVKIDHTDIKCDFENKKADFFAKTAIYVRPSALLALAVYVGIYYLKIRKTLKKLDTSKKETANHE